MKKILRYGTLAFLAAIFLGTSVIEANAQNVLNDILKRMDAYNSSIQSLQAEVTMTKHNPQLNVTDTLIGTTSFLPSNNKRKTRYMRLDWKTENGRAKQESILVIGDDYELYSGGTRNQVIFGKVNKAKNNASAGGVLSFMSMSKEQLKANYDVTYIGEESVSGGTRTWHLQLTPKGRSDYKGAELWVDPHGMPRQAKVIENNSDTTTVLLSGDRKNETLDAGVFKPNWPKNAKRVQG